ncbi:MAG: sirohydrochlorin cobaltochelatase [Intestinibacillus sp.]
MGKKALMVVSFGTTYPEARKAIEKLEKRLQDAFPDHDFFRAFTSDMVRRKVEREEAIIVPNPAELLAQLADEGYEEVRCQSLHVIFGYEYEKLLAQLAPYQDRFKHFVMGKPLLWDTGDYLCLVRALLAEMPRLGEDEAFVFMGHGTEHPANAAYALVENVFRYAGAERVYVATVEGFPHLDYVLARLEKKQIARVYLAPLMIVAGDHAQNDLAGDEDDSWKSRLLHEGYEVETHLFGLGELDAVGALFENHCREAEMV